MVAQIVCSSFINHFGVFESLVQPISALRLFGIVLSVCCRFERLPVVFGGWGVGVRLRVGLEVRRMADCVEGGSFRPSRLGVHRCF